MPDTPSGSEHPRKAAAPENAAPEAAPANAPPPNAVPIAAARKLVPRNLKPYFLCLLRRGPLWNETDGQEDLGPRHLAFLRSQMEAGRLVAAGPALDVPEQNQGEAEVGGTGAITGITLIRAANLEAAIALAKEDPAVMAQRLTAEVLPVLLPSLDTVRVEF
jgi:uncharacterized protein YciI